MSIAEVSVRHDLFLMPLAQIKIVKITLTKKLHNILELLRIVL